MLFILVCKNSSSGKLLIAQGSLIASIFSEWSEFFVPFWQSKSFLLPTRKEKYPVLRTYWSLTDLIKHTKISYLNFIASLVFHRFSCGTCWNGLHQVPQGWGTPSTSKSANHVSLLPFVGNPHYSIFVHRVRYLKKIYLCLEDKS